MFEGALLEVHRAHHVQLTAWAGVEVPTHFADPQGEYEALRGDVGLLDLSWLGTVEFTGLDRVQFLNGMLSNDVRNLGATGGCHTSVLTVHGKMVASAVILSFEDRVLLIANADRVQAVAEHLDRFLIADEVEIRNCSDELGLLGLCGPNTLAFLERMGWPAPDTLWSHVKADEDGEIVRWKLTGQPSWVILAGRAHMRRMWDSLASAGATPVGFDALNAMRIEAGIPWYGAEATEEPFPLETGFDDTISATKGCYLGQETITRILHRGHVNRKLYGLVVEGNTVPPAGSEVLKDGKAIGWITSAVRSPRMGKAVAMAVLRLRGLEPGTRAEISSPTGQLDAAIAELPFV